MTKPYIYNACLTRVVRARGCKSRYTHVLAKSRESPTLLTVLREFRTITSLDEVPGWKLVVHYVRPL